MDHFHYYCWSSKCDYKFFIQALSAVRFNNESDGGLRWKESKLHFIFHSFDQTHTKATPLTRTYINDERKAHMLMQRRIGSIIIKNPLMKPQYENLLFKLQHMNEWEEKVLGFIRSVDCALVGWKRWIWKKYWNNFYA